MPRNFEKLDPHNPPDNPNQRTPRSDNSPTSQQRADQFKNRHTDISQMQLEQMRRDKIIQQHLIRLEMQRQRKDLKKKVKKRKMEKVLESLERQVGPPNPQYMLKQRLQKQKERNLMGHFLMQWNKEMKKLQDGRPEEQLDAQMRQLLEEQQNELLRQEELWDAQMRQSLQSDKLPDSQHTSERRVLQSDPQQPTDQQMLQMLPQFKQQIKRRRREVMDMLDPLTERWNAQIQHMMEHQTERPADQQEEKWQQPVATEEEWQQEEERRLVTTEEQRWRQQRQKYVEQDRKLQVDLTKKLITGQSINDVQKRQRRKRKREEE